MMANKAMMPRHWERLAQITGHTFDVEADNFLLRNLMEAPLLENKEDIEVSEYRGIKLWRETVIYWWRCFHIFVLELVLFLCYYTCSR